MLVAAACLLSFSVEFWTASDTLSTEAVLGDVIGSLLAFVALVLVKHA